MSLMVLGLSHHNAPLDLLERASLDASARERLLHAAAASHNVGEVVVVSTCNRTELYVEALTFHGAVADLTETLVAETGVERAEITERLYLHYEDRAIAHTFRVASGLDSMAVGESQIRAQLRTSLREAQEQRLVGGNLNTLFQQALRVGKRVHTETEIESVSHSLLDVGLSAARELTGLAEPTVLVVGAGAMASLAATAAARTGSRVIVANRTLARGEALAERVGGHAIRLTELARTVIDADVVISCVGSLGVVLDRAALGDTHAARGGRPLVFLDLALPHDIARDVTELPGVTRLGLDDLGQRLAEISDQPAVRDADDLVTGEVAAYLLARATETATPTIAALRGRATEVLQAELARLATRTPDLDPRARREVEIAMGRLIDKLLHTPTVRAKQLAADGRFEAYADALAEVFALDPRDIAAVAAPPPPLPGDREEAR